LNNFVLQILSIEQRGRKHYYGQASDHYPNVFENLLYHSSCPHGACLLLIRWELSVCSWTGR
jgi:hypothetical protein